MNIKTQFNGKTWPSEKMSWQAWSAIDADTYDGGNIMNRIGWGKTEAEAIEDLKSQFEPDYDIAWDAPGSPKWVP